MPSDPRPSDNARRISSLESDVRTLTSDVGELKTATATIVVEQRNAAERADERHDLLRGTTQITKDGVEALRQMMIDEASRRAEREAKREEAERQAAEEAARWWRDLLGNPRAWVVGVLVLFLVLAPQTAPLLLHYGAQWLGLSPPGVEAQELLQDATVEPVEADATPTMALEPDPLTGATDPALATEPDSAGVDSSEVPE